MKLILNFLGFSLLAQSVTAQVARPVVDICLPNYRLSRAEATNCQIKADELSPFLIRMTMLGNNLKDGFRFNWNPNQMNGHFSTVLFADNGTTTPIPGVFQACPGNWLYFKGSGFRKSILSANVSEPFQDVSFRVRYWGDIRNPDSLKMEYKSATLKGAYVTTRRDSVCDKCLATDKIPPHIIGCPTKIVELPMPAAHTKVNGDDVMRQVGIKVTDNCSVYSATNYPHLISVTDGQVVDYQTIAYDQSGNRSDCRFKVKFHSTLADTCLVKFKLDHGNLVNCKMTPKHAPFRQEIQLLGKQIKDGFSFFIQPNLMNGRNETFITGKNGTTVPPQGSTFSACAGPWTYFKAIGYRKQLFVNPNAKEFENIIVRIKHFGNERNPDSLWMEFAEPLNTVPYFVSVKKDTVCNKCLATDKTPPQISNCPTSVIRYPLSEPQIPLRSLYVVSHAGIQVLDNCQLLGSTTYPYRIDTPKIGQVIDYKLVAYDDAGNKSICLFKTKLVSPPNDTCFASFGMESSTPTCDGVRLLNANGTNKSIRLLGKRMADGIEIHSSWHNPIGSASSSHKVFGKNGSTTPPAGSNYSTCSGNWTYFIASGLSHNFTIHNTTKTEVTNVHLRVKYFGNESNPDSLRIEYSSGDFYNTSTKQTYCDKCAATDQTAPVFQHCPTQMVPVTNTGRIYGDNVAKAAFTVTDNCDLENVSTYPYDVRNVKNGQIIDFHTVAYDKSGNKNVCHFKAQVIAPAPASAKLVENQSVAFEIQGINPNPTDGALTVTLESNVAKEVTFDFYNSLGEKAHSVTAPVQKGENNLFFDVTKLANGIYFIQTSEQGEKIHLAKFVKH